MVCRVNYEILYFKDQPNIHILHILNCSSKLLILAQDENDDNDDEEVLYILFSIRAVMHIENTRV